MTTERSSLTPLHDLGFGMRARDIRALRDTRQSSWVSTHAFTTEIDVLLNIRFRCSCRPADGARTDWSRVVPEFRITYPPTHQDGWYGLAQHRAVDHLTTPRHLTRTEVR